MVYDELVKRLREEASSWCANCCYREGNCICAAPDDSKKDCDVYTKLQAAAAIEGLICEVADEHNARLDAEERQRWIPVTERLPQGGDKSGQICANVLLYFDDGNVYPGWMNGRSEKVYYLDDDNDYVLRAPISRVNMWQPLPEPPKEG